MYMSPAFKCFTGGHDLDTGNINKARRPQRLSMPHTQHSKRGWHLPGYNYCGPFTNQARAGKLTNAVDACCKQHDEA